MGFMEKIFGDVNSREVKKIEKIVDRIEALDASMAGLSDEELRNKTQEFKDRYSNGESLDDLLPEAFAVCREGAWRSLGMKHFRVQLIGGVVLHQGRIAEMKTGEGKTLVATLPVYLNALTGKGVHVVTVNDYLAKRDAEWMGKLYNFLGLSVGCVIHGITGAQRRKSYLSDITYGTNNEFGFDYLRDNMVTYKEQLMQRDLAFALIDEVDSILIDEARTPLIISGKGEDSSDLYERADRFVRTLKGKKIVKEKKGALMAFDDGADEDEENYDFIYEEKDKQISLTDRGVKKAEAEFNLENYGDPENMEINHHVQQALKAHNTMERDVEYIVQGDEIIIVDEFTGRLMYGRRFSNGLHQAIEAKEHVKIKSESKTLATITLQNYFRMYGKLAGMTGTAKTEEEEFRDIYNMDVVVIPTNKPVAREDLPDSIYQSERGKFNALVEKVIEVHETGQPILVGTVSVEKSEHISDMLKKRNVKHNVLNAKHHEQEAEIVAQAGRLGAVTIATNMAGRGTDIILGGNPEFEARKELQKAGFETSQIEAAVGVQIAGDFDDFQGESLEEYRQFLMRNEPLFYNRIDEMEQERKAELGIELTAEELKNLIEEEKEARKKARELYLETLEKLRVGQKEEHDQVVNLGGLFILGSERHESRRIDNQLRGRSGRQGDPGVSQFFISMEDDLMRLFGGERMQSIVSKVGMDEEEALEAGILSKSIENAQKRVEGRNFSVRKYVLQYDNVMNKQREIIYGERRKVLFGEDLKDDIMHMKDTMVDALIAPTVADSKFPEEWDLETLDRNIRQLVPAYESKERSQSEITHLTEKELREEIVSQLNDIYDRKEEEIGADHLRQAERAILLRVVDNMWMDHIDAMDQLKSGIGLRSIGQQDPAAEYAKEGFDMFDQMIGAIQEDTVKYCYNVSIATQTERRQVVQVGQARKDDYVDEEAEEASAALRGGGRKGNGGVKGVPARGAKVPPREKKPETVRRSQPKINRNDPCPCGSGKKYKNCHGRPGAASLMDGVDEPQIGE